MVIQSDYQAGGSPTSIFVTKNPCRALLASVATKPGEAADQRIKTLLHTLETSNKQEVVPEGLEKGEQMLSRRDGESK